MRARRPASRGFALVIVLWSIGMLALVGTQLTAAARVQMRLAAQTRDEAMAEAAADGATREAMFILLGGGRPGTAAQPMRVRLGDASVTLMAQDEGVKINPNTVSRDVLRGLLAAVGVDQARAALLAGEMTDWRLRSTQSVLGGLKIDQYRDHGLPYRAADRPYYSVEEMSMLPDMTPEIMLRLRPWLSVYHEGSVSDPTRASPAATAVGDAALSQAGATLPSFGSDNVVMHVTAVAVIPGRARFVRSTVVRIRADAATIDGKPLQILTWE